MCLNANLDVYFSSSQCKTNTLPSMTSKKPGFRTLDDPPPKVDIDFIAEGGVAVFPYFDFSDGVCVDGDHLFALVKTDLVKGKRHKR